MKLLRNPANWARVGMCLMLGAASLAVVHVAPAAAASGPVVTNCGDSGPGSLRQAVADAASGDTVTFALAPACSLITLTSGAIQSFSMALTVAGPGATALAVSGNQQFTVFSTGGSGSSVTLSGLTIENGRAGSLTGGGIAVNSGSLTLRDSVVTGNSNALKGGGIDSSSGGASLTVINSTISNNTGVSGAGINASTAGVTVIGSTFTGNSNPNAQGGAIASAGPTIVQNSTFVGNSGCSAGALYNRQGAAQVSSSTFALNRASCTGGSALANGVGAAMTVSGSVFDSETCSGVIIDGGFNLDTGHACVTSTAHAGVIDTPSGLDPDGPKSNGGPTQTIALLPGSAAIGLVDSATLCSTADQRGTVRPTPICDAGAFQTSPPVAVATTSVPAGRVGASYTASLSATPGVAPYSWAKQSGSLAPGVNLSPAGVLSGAPTTAGTYSFVVQVTDSNSPPGTATKSLSITVASAAVAVFRITTTSLPNAKLGTPYSKTIVAADGVAPYKWKKFTKLPTGLKLNAATGVISGTPKKTRGTFTFTVQASYKTKAPKQPAVTHIATKSLSLAVA